MQFMFHKELPPRRQLVPEVLQCVTADILCQRVPLSSRQQDDGT